MPPHGSPEILPEEFAISYRAKSPNPDDWEKFVYASKKMWLNEVWIPKELLPKIECKVLVLFGDRDQFIPLSHSFEIHDMPKARDDGIAIFYQLFHLLIFQSSCDH